jgi:four helix bundle protein
MSGWTRVEEIVAYQVSVTLRDEVLALIDSGAIPYNFRYREDMGAAARSVPANISEGFDLYKHGRFGFHVGVAKGSLGELETHLNEARTRQFISEDTLNRLLRLLVKARRTVAGLLRHLKTTEAPTPWQQPPPNT